jgi:hypothetical protein
MLTPPEPEFRDTEDGRDGAKAEEESFPKSSPGTRPNAQFVLEAFLWTSCGVPCAQKQDDNENDHYFRQTQPDHGSRISLHQCFSKGLETPLLLM